MKIGFIGYGEAAYNISLGLGNEGITGIVAFDAMADDAVMGKLVHSRAAEAKVTILKSAREVAESCDVVFAAVDEVPKDYDANNDDDLLKEY